MTSDMGIPISVFSIYLTVFMEEKVFIKNENDAILLLEMALKKQIDNADIVIDGWTGFSVKFHGDGFDGSVTASIAKTIIDIQNTVNGIYCMCKYGTASTRRLKAEEREALQVKVNVKEGCTELDLVAISKYLFDAISKMSDPYQAVVYIFFIAACFGGVGTFFWLKNKDRESQRQHEIELKKETTAQLQVFSDFAKSFPQCQTAISMSDRLHESVMKTASTAESLEINGAVLNGEDLKAIQQKKRNTSNQTSLEGDFRVDAADSSNDKYWEFHLARADGKIECTAKTDNRIVIDDLHQALKDKNYVHLNIDVTMLNGEIKDAWIYPADDLDIE